MRNILLYTFCAIFPAFVIAGDFIIKDKNELNSVIELNLGTIEIDKKNDYDLIISNTEGKTQNFGEPELPTYTFSYAVDYDKNYSVELVVNDYIIYNNINLYPSQPNYKPSDTKEFVKNKDIYASNTIFPTSKINTKRMSLRGYELLSIEVVPYEYNPVTKELRVFNNPEIVITETENRATSNRAPRSEIFESMFKNQVLNSDDYQDTRSFQKPSILYICGGSLATSPYLESLIEWRHKQGYIVNVVSSSDAGSSTTNIKNYISNAYNNWENPPEHVCLIGDADGSISVSTYTVYGGNGWSSAQGEGDYPYTLLEGNDLLPEVTIGRMSIRSTTELITAINKIIGYEKNYANDLDWLRSMALVGDPNDSGISTVITNQYIEQIADIHGGITDIRTKYSGGNDYDDWMRNQINDGVAYMNYRGFYGFSGFTSSDVNQLNNGYKLPFLATLTCGTGSFATETTCMTESLYRAGTSVTPKGAVAVIGTAQSYTHTAFNNIVDMGIFDGIFKHDVKTAGEAVVYGKLAINSVYPQNPNDNVYLFQTWNNLLGDPALQLWTSSPSTMVVQHDQMVINGSNNFQVLITSQLGMPIENMIVTLSREDNLQDEFFETRYTDANGIADFMLPDNLSSGNVYVTSRKQNYMPDESFFIISNDLPELTINEASILVDDSENGNSDMYLNPGELASISFEINNSYNTSISNLYAEVTTNSEYITLSNNIDIDLGTISANGSISLNNLSIMASSQMSDFNDPMLRVKLYSTSDDLLWNYILPINFSSANLDLDFDLDSNLSVGESSTITLSIDNNGTMVLDDLTAEINYYGSLLTLSDNSFSFNSLNPGESSNSINTISISVASSAINGTVLNIPLTLSSSNGYEIQSNIQLQIGEVTVNDPVGPDSHGYYIYDTGDNSYELAPTYDWIEIDPDLGGNGNQVDVYDGGNNQDDVTTVDLPFTFTFYGVNYDQVSICSNGWISFGETEMSSFRNYLLPGSGGPSPIVAVFWDDLKTTNGGEIYSYYDQINDAFIIEWSNLRTYINNSTESFQIILYNTGNETSTGDDEMKMQYKDFNNTSVGDYPVGNYDGAVIHGQYCTVGLENHLGDDGLQYTFNNTYSAGARNLNDQSALFITTRGSTAYAQPEASYNTDEFIFIVPQNEQEASNLSISNEGEEGSILVYDLNVAPYPVDSSQIDQYGYAWIDSNDGGDITSYEWIDITADNTVLDFESNDTATEINLDFDFPFYDNNYTSCLINPNGWIGFEGDNDGWNNQSIFDDESPNGAIFGFWDDLNPANSGNEVGSGYVKYHSNEDRLVIWYDNVVHWTSLERIYDFQIVIYPSGKIDMNYRSMFGEIASSTIGIKSPDGNYGLEVIHNDSFMSNNLSVSYNTSKWLSTSLLSGNSTQLAYGLTATYSVNVNTDDLEEGIYTSYVVNSTNAMNNTDIFPVILNTQDSFLLGDVTQDGVLDVLDIVLLISIIMGQHSPSSLDFILSDLNEDGSINVQDCILLINIILNS